MSQTSERKDPRCGVFLSLLTMSNACADNRRFYKISHSPPSQPSPVKGEGVFAPSLTLLQRGRGLLLLRLLWAGLAWFHVAVDVEVDGAALGVVVSGFLQAVEGAVVVEDALFVVCCRS